VVVPARSPSAPLEASEAAAAADGREAQRVLDGLNAFGRLLSVKLYRITLPAPPAVPTLPCLDHEAMLHARIPSHAAAYLQDRSTGDLHELVVIPARRRIEIDVVSTWGEHSEVSHQRLLALIGERFPDYRVRVRGPSWWRGERRVAAACRAQVSLRDVLLGSDMAELRVRIHRLQTIGTLMEKESRVASWGVRTVSGPLLGAAAVATYLVLGGLTAVLGETEVAALRYTLVTGLGTWFLYYGLKAVQLTEMSNRVWKRTAEYSLILAERTKRGL
jgi:hypothetical protein